MKIKSLLSTLAVLVCAATASAQSDPSVGGSFGNSFGGNRTAGKVDIASARDDYAVSTNANMQSRPSFWNRMTGKSRSMTTVNSNNPNRHSSWFNHGPSNTNQPTRHGWFSSHRPTNMSHPAPSHGWFSSHRPATVQNHGTRTSWFHRSAAAPNANTHKSGWHLPFMSRS